MGRKTSYYKQALKVLEELHTKYPQYEMGRHLSIAIFGEYGDTFDMTGKEMLYALQKYQAELELDINCLAQEDFVEQIIEDGIHLNEPKEWDEDEEDDDWEE